MARRNWRVVKTKGSLVIASVVVFMIVRPVDVVVRIRVCECVCEKERARMVFAFVSHCSRLLLRCEHFFMLLSLLLSRVSFFVRKFVCLFFFPQFFAVVVFFWTFFFRCCCYYSVDVDIVACTRNTECVLTEPEIVPLRCVFFASAVHRPRCVSVACTHAVVCVRYSLVRSLSSSACTCTARCRC